MTIPTATAKARDLHSALQSLQKQAIAEKRHEDAGELIDLMVWADHIHESLAVLKQCTPAQIDAVAAFMDRTGPNSPVPPGKCVCRKCNPDAWWFIVSDICGNKRCPHATDHALDCTGSNELGQIGSVFGAQVMDRTALLPEEGDV